ncbi:MAG: acyltransferase [Anaerolineales bacterium]|nr:acyltransferase [Anaerolineales bacterium]
MSDITKGRLQEFEALRGLSIVLLLALHSEVFDPSFFGEGSGPLAGLIASFLLGSFFFLAGYFTEFSIQKKTNLFSFVKSKIIRIFPPYWLALLLFVYGIGYTLKRNDFAVYLLNLQAVFSPVFVKPLLTLWYISMLVVFYIIFCTLLFTIKSNVKLLISSVFVFLLAYIANVSIGLFDPRFFQYYFIFLFGVYFCRFDEIREKLFSFNFASKIILAFITAIMMWLVESYPLTNLFYILIADLFILTWIWMWLGIFRTQVGSWKVWALLSTASFFAYLFHRPLWFFLNQALNIEEAWRQKVLFNLWVGSALALILGYFLQRGYDKLLVMLRLK